MNSLEKETIRSPSGKEDICAKFIIDNVGEAFIFHGIAEKGILTVIENDTSSHVVATTQVKYTMSSNLYLFAQNYLGSPRFGGARQIGYFKYYDKNNDLICNLIPCYRKKRWRNRHV